MAVVPGAGQGVAAAAGVLLRREDRLETRAVLTPLFVGIRIGAGITVF